MLALLVGGAIAAPIAAWAVSRIDHAVLGGLVGGMILFYDAEGVLGLVCLGGSAVVVTRVLIVVGALALPLSTWLRRVRDLEAEAVPLEINA